MKSAISGKRAIECQQNGPFRGHSETDQTAAGSGPSEHKDRESLPERRAELRLSRRDMSRSRPLWGGCLDKAQGETQSEAARDRDGAPLVELDPAREARLPCLRDNNSDNIPLSPLPIITKQGRTVFNSDDHSYAIGKLNRSELKSEFALVGNIVQMVDSYGLERIGFLTLTFRENLTDAREAQRRLNNLNRRVVGPLFPVRICVVEPQKRGAVHYHLLVVCESDIRTGVDFEAFSKKDYRSAGPELRNLWKTLREALPNYKFGRSELMPIRSSCEGISKYVGKYLAKGAAYRIGQFEGMRMVRYSQGWRTCSSTFAWFEKGQAWRELVREIARLLAVKRLEEFSEDFGRYWAKRLLDLSKELAEAKPEELARLLPPTKVRI